MSDILPRKTYRKVLKIVEKYKEEDAQDRLENPSRIPMGWKMSLLMSIEHVMREDHVRVTKGHAERVIDYLVEKKILVHYAGDISFPERELPTEEEIISRTKEDIKRILK